MIPTNKEAIEYIAKKYRQRGEFGDKYGKPMKLYIDDNYIIIESYGGTQSDFGAFAGNCMPHGNKPIITEIWNTYRYYLNDIKIEILQNQ